MENIQNIEGLFRKIEEERKSKDIFFLGVCGLGGVGKTTLCLKLLENFLEQAIHFECDLFIKYLTLERKKRIQAVLENGDAHKIEIEENPCHWYAWDDIEKTISSLRRREEVVVDKGWNQKTGQKDCTVNFKIPNHDHAIVVVDCLYLLHPFIRKQLDKILYIDGGIRIAHEQGRKRDAHRHNSEYRSYKESLTRKYDIPYFEKYRKMADWVMMPDVGNKGT